MKKLYEKYFRIPKNGKISDMVMRVRVATMALCVILCLCAFSISSYAYFTSTVSSEGNVIQAATFEVGVTVTPSDTDIVSYADGVYTLNANTEYTVTLTPTGNATKGFAVVTVASQADNQVLMLAAVDEGAGEGSGEGQGVTPVADISGAGTYYTPQLFESDEAKAATFTVQTTEAVTMTVEAHWGERNDYPNLSATSISAELTPITNSMLVDEEKETPVEEDSTIKDQQEDEQEDQQEEEKETSNEENSVDDPENPTEDSVEDPSEEPTQKPSDEPVEAPSEEHVEEPSGEPSEDLPDEPTEESTEQPAEVPIEQPTEAPVEGVVDEPVDQLTE